MNKGTRMALMATTVQGRSRQWEPLFRTNRVDHHWVRNVPRLVG